MSTSLESQRAAPDARSATVDPLLTKVCAIYTALKASQTESDRYSTDAVACKRYRDANSLNVVITNAQKRFKRDWHLVSPAQRLLLLDLLLGSYCRSKRGDDVRAKVRPSSTLVNDTRAKLILPFTQITWSSVCDQLGFSSRANARDKCVRPPHLPLSTFLAR